MTQRADLPPAGAQVRILPAGEDALAELEALERDCFSVPWNRQSLAEALASPYIVLRQARLDGACAGYLCASALFGEAEILRVAVAPVLRRRGVARALLRKFLAEHPGYATFLEVRASNIAARTLYESEGFAVTGVRRHYYEHPAEDALCMTRPPQPVKEA